MGAQILDELLEVQNAVTVGVAGFHDLKIKIIKFWALSRNKKGSLEQNNNKHMNPHIIQ